MNNFNFLEIPELAIDRVIPSDQKDDSIYIDCHLIDDRARCPMCHQVSTRVHSKYQRVIQDAPVSGHTTWLRLTIRKFFCDNDDCQLKIFKEPLSFVQGNSRRTNRLNDIILHMVAHESANASVSVLRALGIIVHKSSICDLLTANRTES